MNKTTFEHKYNIGDEVWYAENLMRGPSVDILMGEITKIFHTTANSCLADLFEPAKYTVLCKNPVMRSINQGDIIVEMRESDLFFSPEKCIDDAITYIRLRMRKRTSDLLREKRAFEKKRWSNKK